MTDQNQLNVQRTNLDNIEQAWDGDLWDRKRLGVQLTNYVDRLNCGAVLALDARWGEGKTWFVRHWKKHLEENHNVIYLDAFANDYLEDPFLVITSEIALKLDQTADKGLVYKFKKAAAVLQQGLLTQAPTILSSMISFALTGGIIPFLQIRNESVKEKYDSIVDKVTENIGEKVTEAIQKKIDDYEEEQQSLHTFKETLAQLAHGLDKPLVFIIDELDRCRPDFAIRLIERIKHFFDIPKIVFVLVVDKKQFSKVVCHNYGYDEQLGEEYLDKFVDFTIKLQNFNKTSLYDLVISEHLFKIGELLDKNEKNEIYFTALAVQLECKCNSRELRKKINQYALLKTESMKLNVILYILIFYKDSSNSIVSFIEFLNSISEQLLVHLYEDRHYVIQKYRLSEFSMGIKFKEQKDSYFLNFALKQDFNLIYIVHSFLSNYRSANKVSDSDYTERNVKILFQQYSVSNLDNIEDFLFKWDEYISSGL